MMCEGKLLRLAESYGVAREEYLKHYFGHELEPGWMRRVSRLKGKGWDVDDCDLNAEGFFPVLSCEERRGYHDVGPNLDPVQSYVDRVQAAAPVAHVLRHR